jgi:hypothetical protein
MDAQAKEIKNKRKVLIDIINNIRGGIIDFSITDI